MGFYIYYKDVVFFYLDVNFLRLIKWFISFGFDFIENIKFWFGSKIFSFVVYLKRF